MGGCGLQADRLQYNATASIVAAGRERVMLRIKNQRVVNAPVDKVFGYLADFTHLSEWLWKGRRVTTSGGSAFTVQFGRGNHITFQVIAFVDNERLVWEREDIGERHFIELQTFDGGTRIAYGYEFVGVSPPVLLAMLPLWLLSLSPLGRWYDGRTMRRLQERLESES